MDIWWAIAKGCASVVLVPVVIHYFYSAYANPKLFLERSQNTRMSWGEKFYFGLAIAGLFLIAFNGFRWMFNWIPYSIGSHDESGEFRPFRDLLSFMLAALSFPLLSFLDGSAIARLQLEEARKRIGELEGELTSLKSQNARKAS